MILAALGPFGDAIDFIFNERESQAGTVTVGGLGEMWELTWTHLQLALTATLLATAFAMPLGIWLGHIGRYQFAATSISNIGRAIPALGLVVFFIAFLGVGFLNVCVALVLLAIPPIITNSYVGIRGVDPETVDAAGGNGLTGRQVALQVELPMALPTIMAGIRISLVSVIATATIAPLANVDTLGRPIISPNVYGTAGQLAACIVVALVTFGADALFALFQRGRDARGPQACRTGPARWPPPRLPVIEEEHADIVKRTHPLLALLAILCLGFVFAACGDDEEPSSSVLELGQLRGGARQGDPDGLRRRGQDRSPSARRTSPSSSCSARSTRRRSKRPGFTVKRQLNLGSELIALQVAAGRQDRRLPGVHRHRADLVLRGQDRRRPEGRQQGVRGHEGRLRQGGHHRAAPDAVREHLPPRHDQGGGEEDRRPEDDPDLKGKEGDLAITGFPECKQRQDCLLGVEDTYGLKFGKFVSSEQKYQVLDSGDADVAFIFTTDGDLPAASTRSWTTTRSSSRPTTSVRDPQRGAGDHRP